MTRRNLLHTSATSNTAPSSPATRNSLAMNRRRFLRGVLGGAAVSVALPFFEFQFDATGKALASGSAFPKRFGLFFWGNGIIPKLWVPEKTGNDYALSYLLEPLAPIKSRMTLVTGTALRVPNIEPHFSGMSGVLTGTPLLFKPGGDYTFPAPTVDQLIAAAIGNDTRFRSIEFGARPQRPLSFNGPDNFNPSETSPFSLFSRIFGEEFREPGDNSAPDPALKLRRSVLDSVVEDITTFEAGLGTADKARLDQHLTSVRELETRLARLAENPANLAACRKADEPLADYPDINGRPQLAELNRAMCDIMALACACDQTRVFSNCITTPLTNLLLADAQAGHHQLTHDEPGDQPQVQSVIRLIMSEFAYLVQALDAIPEGDGTLLDNMVLLATSDVSYGRTHALDEFPILYAGGAQGKLKLGTHIRSPIPENTGSIMLSLMRSLDIVAKGFGAPDQDAYTEDGYSAIEL